MNWQWPPCGPYEGCRVAGGHTAMAPARRRLPAWPAACILLQAVVMVLGWVLMTQTNHGANLPRLPLFGAAPLFPAQGEMRTRRNGLHWHAAAGALATPALLRRRRRRLPEPPLNRRRCQQRPPRARATFSARCAGSVTATANAAVSKTPDLEIAE